MGRKDDNVTLGATYRATIRLPREEVEAVRITGTDYHVGFEGDLAVVTTRPVHNALVNQGLNSLLDSWFNDLAANRITHIGLSEDATAVTASTTTIGTQNSIKTIANVSRTAQTVSGDATWTQADVTWVVNKIGLLYGATATSVASIIGGGGTAPYDESFSLDLTSATTFSLTMGVDMTATAS